MPAELKRPEVIPQTNTERFPGQIYVALLLTHGRSNRLLLTRHLRDGVEKWGPVAGGVEQNEGPWEAVVRETNEEAGIPSSSIIFVRGRDSVEPHVALLPGNDKNKIGLIYSATYSGPKIPLDGWEVKGDEKVDQAAFFPWQNVCKLLERGTEGIYAPEFNIPQLIRWLINSPVGVKNAYDIHKWLAKNMDSFPGLTCLYDKNSFASQSTLPKVWKYIPPYNEWMNMSWIHGVPARTNFARKRFLANR